MTQKVIVLGAGIIGVCSALALQSKGCQVTLIDRKPPGNEASFGNAGIFATNGLIPLNSPSLIASLPKILLSKQQLYVRYNWNYVLRNIPTLTQFIWQGREQSTVPRIKAMHALISHSQSLNRSLLEQTQQLHRLRDKGWLRLYRSQSSFAKTAYEQAILKEYGVNFQTFNQQGIQDLEPNIKPVFEKGILISSADSIDNPHALVKACAELFIERGGQWLQRDIHHAKQTPDNHWQLEYGENNDSITLKCQQLVIAMGAYSKTFLASLGIKLPMINERGGHRHFTPVLDQSITRPIYDEAGGYVLTPMEQGMRITCGVELNHISAPYSSEQLDGAESIARDSFHLGESIKHSDWMGIRPTLPDYLPAIGKTQKTGLWLNTGHQHLGLTTASGSAALLADQIVRQQTNIEIDPSPFLPARFNI